IELTLVQGRRISHLGTFGPGELIGELDMLDGGARTTTAVARGDTVLLAIEPDPFLELLEPADPIVKSLVDSLLHRIRGLLARMPADAELTPEDLPVDDPEERAGIDKIRLEAQLRDALDTRT